MWKKTDEPEGDAASPWRQRVWPCACMVPGVVGPPARVGRHAPLNYPRNWSTVSDPRLAALTRR